MPEPYIPTPPPFPKYDPDEDVPKWDLPRLSKGMPFDNSRLPKIGQQPATDDDPDWRGVIKNKSLVMDMPEAKTLGAPRNPKYYFFDTPDYADPFKKIWYSTKFFTFCGFAVGSSVAFINDMSYSLASHYWIWRKFVKGPMIAGLVGATTVCVVANLRGKKDDKWNYFFGGFAATLAVGYRCHLIWFRSSLVIMPLAIWLKHMAENNYSMLPLINFRRFTASNYGHSTEGGIKTGDWRFGLRSNYGDPGRDQRRVF